MNRLKQYLREEEPLMPEGDYWVVETRCECWFVSADTAPAIGACGRAFDRARRLEDKADRRPWEED